MPSHKAVPNPCIIPPTTCPSKSILFITCPTSKADAIFNISISPVFLSTSSSIPCAPNVQSKAGLPSPVS